MKKLKLNVDKRKVLGRKVKKLRSEGVLPANIYGKGVKSQSVEISLKDFQKIYQETGETGVIDLTIKGEKKSRPVLIHNVQLDPVAGLCLHADLHQISLKEKTTVKVPVELIGEAPAEKENKGILVTLIDEIEVEALPADLPEKLEVTISNLTEINDVVRVKDIKVDQKGVKILTQGNDIVAKIEPLTKEEVIEKKPEEALAEEEKPEEAKPEEAKPEEEKTEELKKEKKSPPAAEAEKPKKD